MNEVAETPVTPEGLFEMIVKRPITRQTFNEGVYLLSTLPVAIVAMVVWTAGGALSIGFAITVLGLPLAIGMLYVFKQFAVFERNRLKLVDERPLAVVYKPEPQGFFNAIGTLVTDVQTWKDFGWMVVVSTLGLVFATAMIAMWGFTLGYLLFPAWGWALPGGSGPLGVLSGNDLSFTEAFLGIPLGIVAAIATAWICAGMTAVLVSIARSCLGTNEQRALAHRVSDLERSREDALSQQTTELSRIERDLHDGAQARLVALALDLGMAETKVDDDPAAAKQLVAEARDEAQRALQELRDLVRGIGPQILRDRGLQAALIPLTARSPIPVELKVEIGNRPSETVEACAYFVTSEALANAIKHSEASKINVNVVHHDEWLFVRVSDNGKGGAAFDAGEGLQGLKARVAAVDGTLSVDSPPDGPTIIDAWIPFA
jgi:signal transduction histidine kinase